MAGKNKGGREARKPKADKNTKAKGQTPTQLASDKGAITNLGHRGK